jgi:serine/threonine-protein phosphatase 5
LIFLLSYTNYIEKDFRGAAEKYTEAIKLYPTAVFYSNRSMAMIKMECYGLAINDANEAIAFDPRYVKAYYRYYIHHK